MQRAWNLDQKVQTMGKQIHHHKPANEKLAHKISQLKRLGSWDNSVKNVPVPERVTIKVRGDAAGKSSRRFHHPGRNH